MSPVTTTTKGSAARKTAAALLIAGAALAGGCSTPGLDAARETFYAGKPTDAVQYISNSDMSESDRVLVLMERGTLYQALHNYSASVADWQEAVALLRKYGYYSVSKGAASYLVNDTVMTFVGMPFEQTLIHSMSAKSYMALSLWSDAAVEGRNIIYRLENRPKGFADDPYSRYLAGFTLELVNDSEGAAFQYRIASEMLPSLGIDRGGRITCIPGAFTNAPPSAVSPGNEFVCFVMLGRTPGAGGFAGYPQAPPYAEFYDGTNYLGRSHAFVNTAVMMQNSLQQIAAMKAAKTVARVAVKISVAEAIERHDRLLGALAKLFFLSTEHPDTRSWDTLPMWFQIARFPCPENLTGYRIVVRRADGAVMKTADIRQPVTRRNNCVVSFYRDIP